MVSETHNGNSDTVVNVSGHRLSTVVTASVSGDTVSELSGMDLAAKLHYLTFVYYFRKSEEMERLTTEVLKEPMFLMLDRFRQVAGRIRRNGVEGRPHIKCNDSGVRFIEAKCDHLSIDEWLETKASGEELVSDKPHGPELQFCTLFMIQITRFKCGGLAVGISWAHVLGDAVAASNCINLWGHLLNGNRSPPPKKSLNSSAVKKTVFLPAAATGDPLSLKQVESVGDLWVSHSKHPPMVISSFQITKPKLERLQSKISGPHIPAFEAIAAFIWHSLAKVRVGKDLHTVTIIHNDCNEEINQSLGNKHIISTVAINCSKLPLAEFEISELADLITTDKRKDENKVIEEMVDRDNGKSDFIIYGANLTFVDMEGVDLYGLNLKGQKPVEMEFSIHGVGDEGAVLVLPKRDDGGKVVTVILPGHEMPKLKQVLGSEWEGIA